MNDMVMPGNAHDSVLLQEALAQLAIKPEGVYVDATFGRGGHARALLDQLSSQGRLIVIDKDPTAIAEATRWAAIDQRISVVHGSFGEIKNIVEAQGYLGCVNGLLLDLGVSSPQLDTAHRGFSFMRDGLLDMRMNTASGVTAAEWLARVSEKELADVLFKYGEEVHSKRIAHAILDARQKGVIATTAQLAEIIKVAHPRWIPGKHPATQSFQAIRIFINHELDDLSACLDQSLEVLAPGGRLVVISFHSLEDRMVKRFIQKNVRGDVYPAKLPIKDDCRRVKMRCVGKGVKPHQDEVANNVRSRSAIMRTAEKI